MFTGITRHLSPGIFLPLIAFLTYTFNLAGQTGSDEPVDHPWGISLRYGMGACALRDNYISPERYTGILPFLSAGWTRTHNRYTYRLDFSYGRSNDIKNYNVSTRVVNFKLSQGFLYPFKPMTLFSRDLILLLGPTTDAYYYENDPDIAVSGFDYVNSFSTLVSLGVRGDGDYRVSGRLRLSSSLQFSLLSLGIRTVDSEEDDQPGTKLLTPFAGLNTTFDLGIRFDLLKWLSPGLSYRFELTRISAWENILYANNGAYIGLYFRF